MVSCHKGLVVESAVQCYTEQLTLLTPFLDHVQHGEDTPPGTWNATFLLNCTSLRSRYLMIINSMNPCSYSRIQRFNTTTGSTLRCHGHFPTLGPVNESWTLLHDTVVEVIKLWKSQVCTESDIIQQMLSTHAIKMSASFSTAPLPCQLWDESFRRIFQPFADVT